MEMDEAFYVALLILVAHRLVPTGVPCRPFHLFFPARDSDTRSEMGVLFDPLDLLTPRQLQIMRLSHRGYVASDLAATLCIAPTTLRWHIARIRQNFPTFKLYRPTAASHLTKRERQIAALVSEGLSNPEISELVGLSPSTISHYLTCLYRKTGSTNRVQLALTTLIVRNKVSIGDSEAA
jgi:DNA-binding CsgD family transcriptional regulator